MSAESASQRKRAEGQRNDGLVLAALAGAGDAGLRSGELAAKTRLPARTQARSVGRLVDLGLVVRDGKRGAVRATVAGLSQVGAGTPGLAVGAALEPAVDRFPAEAQRAFARLLLSAIVARHRLAGEYLNGWGGFIVIGPTKTAKTSIATFACQVFGIGSEALRILRDETPGSISGRRQQISGGQWKAAPSPLLGLPFLCLDEYDKAPEEIRREAARLLLGQTEVELEGERFRVHPVPMVILNSKPQDLPQQLHEAFIRRSVVLDTGELGGLLRDIDEDMRRLFSVEGSIPRLDLGKLRPPLKLQDVHYKALRDALKAALTDEGWRLADVEAVSRLALGRIALMGGDAPIEQACLATALDYLVVTETVPGHVRGGAIAQLSGQLGGGVLLVADVGAHATQRTAMARDARDHRVAQLTADAAFDGDRAKFHAELIGSVDGLGRRRDPEAAELRASLRKLAARTLSCKSREALADVEAAAAPFVQRAGGLMDRWKAKDQRDEQARLAAAAQREQAAWNKRQAALMQQKARKDAKAQRAAEAKGRAQWKAALRALYAIPPYDSLRIALDTLADHGWLEMGPDYWGHRVKFGDVPGWPIGTLVDEGDAEDFWAATCQLAEQRTGVDTSQRPTWQSKWELQQAREDAQYRRKLGFDI